MARKAILGLALLVGFGVAYLVFWPVPIEPVAWDAPTNEGYIEPFVPNDKLAKITRVGLGEYSGPEDAAIGPDGMVYIATHEGAIVKYDPTSGNVSQFAETGGRPLGVEFDSKGNLYVADAFLGLLKIARDGQIKVLANETNSGSPIQYADDVDIAPDGSVYFTDASTKFGAQQSGGTLPVSFLDLMEHSSSGRILKYDPANGIQP